jgi:hypothetical protein
MSEITTTVMIADKTGHTTMSLTREETMALPEVSENGHWIFAGGRMVQPQQLQQADWGAIGTVRIVPGLVGGHY